MSNKRFSAPLLLFIFILNLMGGAQAQGFRARDVPALVYVEIQSPSDIERFEATGLTAYARLHGGEPQDYVLSEADASGQALLKRAGLRYHILDAKPSEGGYYLAYAMPGRSIEWDTYGQSLLDDGVQALLRTSPEQAELLAQAGAELRMVTFDPKPLQPASPSLNVPTVIDPVPLIQTIINQVDSDKVYDYTGDLSGEWPVDIGGIPYTIETRYTNSGEPIQKATQYVGEHFTSLGLDVEYHNWNTSSNPNVIAELPGLVNPEDIFIIGAHLDDMPSSGLAPGADDNASGSVATMMAADILTQYQWDCTLRFALWTGEEQGLQGSHAYAQRSSQLGENILGYLNLDMIAWNTPDSSPDIDLIATSSIPETLTLAQLFADVIEAYNLNLIPSINPNGTGASDHASFWNYGYTAILAIEDLHTGDFNPYYHTSNDLLQNLDISYYTEFVKASLATFAHMTGCLQTDEPEYNVALSGDQSMTGLPGETIIYTLSVTHAGIAITDTFAIGLGTSTFTSTADVSEIGPLSPGESAEFHVTVTIPEDALPGESDAVEVTATSQGDDSKSESALLTSMAAVPQADLSVNIAANPNPVQTGATLTYTLTVSNHGPDQVTGVTLVDTLPDSVTYISASEGCNEVGGVVTCGLDELSLGDNLTITIIVTAPGQPGNVTNQATVSADQPDPDESNNITSLDTIVEPSLSGTLFLPLVSYMTP